MRRKFSSVFACAALCCAAISAILATASPSTTRGSSLVAVPETIDLGNVYVGEDQEFVTQLVNRTSKNVEISDTSTGCARTDVTLEARVVAPELKSELRGFLKGKSNPGKFRHHVTIRTRDQATPIVITVVGQAQSRIQVYPELLTLRPDFKSGRSDEGVVTIKNESNTAFVFSDPVLPAGISLEFPERRLSPNSSCKVSVQVDCKLVVPEEIMMRLPIDHSVESHVRVPLKISPRHPVVVQPSEFQFGVVTKEDLLSREPPTILLTGSLLSECDATISQLPRYLSLDRSEQVSPTATRWYFRILDQHRAGFDLKDTAKIELSISHSGLPNDVASIVVPFHGFLTARNPNAN